MISGFHLEAHENAVVADDLQCSSVLPNMDTPTAKITAQGPPTQTSNGTHAPNIARSVAGQLPRKVGKGNTSHLSYSWRITSRRDRDIALVSIAGCEAGNVMFQSPCILCSELSNEPVKEIQEVSISFA
jgi:hypothetical protein